MTDEEYITKETRWDELMWKGPRWLTTEEAQELSMINRSIVEEEERRKKIRLPIRDWSDVVGYERYYQEGEFVPEKIIMK